MKKIILTSLILLLVTIAGIAKTYNSFQVKISGKGKPILLIPGATCSGAEWDETIAVLNSKYECHTITLAGYAGVTPLADAPYLSTMKNDLLDYIKQKNLKNTTLIGHSIGGVLAMWMATEEHNYITKVIIVDAMPFFAAEFMPNAHEGFNKERAEQALTMYQSLTDSSMKAQQLGMAQFMCLDSTKWERIVDWGVKSDKKTLAYTMTEMNGLDLRKKVSGITAPTLVLVAYAPNQQYPSFTAKGVKDKFSEQYKACSMCTLMVSTNPTKHFIMYDDPKWFIEQVRNFIEK